MIDTNVFVSAIKNYEKESKTLQLILELIDSDDVRIVGNDYLVMELYKYADEFGYGTPIRIMARLFEKMEVVHVGKNYRRICKNFFDKESGADILHAATCLKANVILITNDKDFDRIRDEGIIEVWSTSEAIRKLL
ncbi:MAG: type II toxin-antitoxin system VapC family toxin [Thermoplasmata archaeon]